MLERGFTRLRCDSCKREHLLAFSCKSLICPSCGARRMAQTAAHLVDSVFPEVPVRQWILTPPSERTGLLAARGEVLSKMCRIFAEEIFRSLKSASGFEREMKCGAVTFIQRFTKTLAVYPHLHVLVPDGVFVKNGEQVIFREVVPNRAQLQSVVDRVFQRMKRLLERGGYCREESELSTLDRWYVRALEEPTLLKSVGLRSDSAVACGGFRIHAGVRVNDKEGLEKLCRYAARPPFAEEQLQIEDDRIRFELRRPGKNGQRTIEMTPVQFLRKLAWLVPPPRQNQIRFHGVFAGNAKWRKEIVPGSQVRLVQNPTSDELAHTVTKKFFWAALLKRTYGFEVLDCPHCSGKLRPLAVVKEKAAIEKILKHFGLGANQTPTRRHQCVYPLP